MITRYVVVGFEGLEHRSECMNIAVLAWGAEADPDASVHARVLADWSHVCDGNG